MHQLKSTQYLSDEVLGTDRVDSADLGQRLDVSGAVRRVRVEPAGPARAVALARLVGREGEVGGGGGGGGEGWGLRGAARVAGSQVGVDVRRHVWRHSGA